MDKYLFSLLDFSVFLYVNVLFLQQNYFLKDKLV